MQVLYTVILICSIVFFSTMLTALAYFIYQRMAMMAIPDARSNHSRPTVTGVGVGFMTTILGFLLVVGTPNEIVFGGLILMLVSAWDDLKSSSIRARLLVQFLAVAFAVSEFGGTVFQGLVPVWADYLLTLLLWLWMINLTNFMDGIDEITVYETVSICGSLIIYGLFSNLIPYHLSADALVIAAAAACFLPWNTHPARCFMGDSGSVPLGFLLGYLLFSLAASGQWVLALILPAYYVCDATVTLLKRTLRGEPIWQAHSQHCYQQAVRSGHTHHWVTIRVASLNALLFGLGIIALLKPEFSLLALAAAYSFALAMCSFFSSCRSTRSGLMVYEAST